MQTQCESSVILCYLHLSVDSASRREMDWVMQRCRTYRETEPSKSVNEDSVVQLNDLPKDCTILDITRLFYGIFSFSYSAISIGCWEHCGISPSCFLTEHHMRQINQGCFVLLYFVLFAFWHNLSTYGRRAFSVTDPAAWNCLCNELREQFQTVT